MRWSPNVSPLTASTLPAWSWSSIYIAHEPGSSGVFPDPAGGLDGTDEMHGHEGLNPCAGPAAGVRQSALSCKLSDKVVKVSGEHLCGMLHPVTLTPVLLT